MIAIIVTGALLAISSASAVGQNPKAPFETIGAWEACQGKEEASMCEYAPHNLEGNYLFSYTHQQQLDKSLTEYLPERGIHKDDWINMLVILSDNDGSTNYKKPLDVNFLYLNDPFDGSVTPNDFPVKVFLKETKKGQCWGRLAEKRMCVGVRSMLWEACNGKQDGDECSYKSLGLEKEYIDKDKKEKMSFWGQCEKAKVPEGEEGWNWCKLRSPREQEIEACLGKLPGKVCEYQRAHEKDVYQGICMGASEGNTLACQGGNAHMIGACKGKVRGDKCTCKHGMDGKEFKGWCGYTKTAMQCMNEKMKPKPEPEPEPEPPKGGACDLKKEVMGIAGWVKSIAKKVGAAPPPSPEPEPEPTPEPKPTLGPKPTKPPTTEKPTGKPEGRRRTRRRRRTTEAKRRRRAKKAPPTTEEPDQNLRPE